MTWNDLNTEDKKEYELLFNLKLGSTDFKSETGEPLYFDDKYNMYKSELLMGYFINYMRFQKIKKLKKLIKYGNDCSTV